jgi:Rieske Fe-S protein
MAPQPVKQSSSVKGPVMSRRSFVVGAMGASLLLTAGAVAGSGGILGPLVPTKEGDTLVANWNDLNTKYNNVKNTSDEYNPSNYSQFFYYPYPVSDSPYYKNVIARLPDPLVNPYYQSDQILKHVVAFNLTCVHLRCIVNPGYAGNPGSGEFRLQCPCHGSQYRLVDAVAVAGPAYDLGLLPLPRVQLKADATTGNITATNLDGDPGIGRSD